MSHEHGKGAGDQSNTSRDREGWTEFWRLVKFLTVVGVLMAVVFWPYIFSKLSVLWAPDVVKDVGTVQKLYFVGGFGIDTQVETEAGTFLIWARVNIPKGMVLQSRENYFGRRLCVATTQRCWPAARD